MVGKLICHCTVYFVNKLVDVGVELNSCEQDVECIVSCSLGLGQDRPNAYIILGVSKLRHDAMHHAPCGSLPSETLNPLL